MRLFTYLSLSRDCPSCLLIDWDWPDRASLFAGVDCGFSKPTREDSPTLGGNIWKIDKCLQLLSNACLDLAVEDAINWSEQVPIESISGFRARAIEWGDGIAIGWGTVAVVLGGCTVSTRNSTMNQTKRLEENICKWNAIYCAVDYREWSCVGYTSGQVPSTQCMYDPIMKQFLSLHIIMNLKVKAMAFYGIIGMWWHR